jgi:hypothetical protein
VKIGVGAGENGRAAQTGQRRPQSQPGTVQSDEESDASLEEGKAEPGDGRYADNNEENGQYEDRHRDTDADDDGDRHRDRDSDDDESDLDYSNDPALQNSLAIAKMRSTKNAASAAGRSGKDSNSTNSEPSDEVLVRRSVDLLSAHKISIAEMVEVMKDEMELVQNMEDTEVRDSEVYIDRLEAILAAKSEAIESLLKRLNRFRRYRAGVSP